MIDNLTVVAVILNIINQEGVQPLREVMERTITNVAPLNVQS